MSKRWLSRSAMVLALALVPTMLGAPDALAVPPPNDTFNNAALIPGLPFEDTLDTSDATTAPTDPDCSGAGDTHSVWYVFTLAADTDVMANTFGSDYDTTLSAYTGPQNALDQVACNDDTNSLQSLISFHALAGTTYHFMVASFDGADGGNLVLSVDVAPPPLELTISIARRGRATSSRAARIHGSVKCSRAASPIDLLGSVRQSRRVGVTLGYFDGSLDCPGILAWSRTVVGETGFYGEGWARATVAATFVDPILGEVTRVSAARNVFLRR